MRPFVGYLGASVAFAAVVLGVVSPAQAATAEIAPSRDNFMMEDLLDASCAVGNLYVGDAFGTSSRRALLRFDIAAEIPAGSTINSAQLQVTIISSEAGADPADPYQIKRAVADWGESTGPEASNCFFGKGTEAETGDVTWSHRFWSTTTWSTPGGNFVPTASAAIAMPLVGAANFPTGTRMVSDVQGWLNSPATNFGWVMIGGEGRSHTQREISSREGVAPPTLLINYTAPVSTTPPEVPDGRLAEPLRVRKLTANGVDLEISWDTSHCTVDPDHNLVYGTRSTFPPLPGDPYGLQGTLCTLTGASPFNWLGSPNPATLDPSSRLIWMLVIANDGGTVEGSWGRRSNFTERNGLGTNGSSGACGITNKSVANLCGQVTLRAQSLLDLIDADPTALDLEAP